MKPEVALQQVLTQLNSDQDKCEAFGSPHEGYAFIQDELDSLWYLVKNNARSTELRAQAKRVAATSMRFMTDCT